MKDEKESRNDYKFNKYEDPYSSDAPWPCMRGDIRNSGTLKNLKFDYARRGIDDVIYFRTGNAIFSTPIIGPNEYVYVGSADHKFYAFDPHESMTFWQYEYGEIVDSAACIDSDGNVYIGAGDAKIHAYSPEGKELWVYDAINDRRKEHFSFSSNFWFEANIVMGPDGALYVANDDFYLYKMSKDGKVIWGYQTGFLIWSAPSFGKDGSVYISGFDHIFYALDMNTGKLNWKTDIRGAMVGSPAVGEDGTIYQSSFNGNIYALNPVSGKIKWKFETGSHIYASPAISSENIAYFGSTNGMFYAVDGLTGKQKWTFYVGDAIRGSSSLGPDPEEKCNYLIYLGAGNGMIYALEPNGSLRWAFNTLVKAQNTDYPNINASIALGFTGLAIASSTGDVIWLPYDYYLKDDSIGIHRGELDNATTQKLQWHFVSAGGKFEREPLSDKKEILPTSIISLRLLNHDKTGMRPVHLKPESIKISVLPEYKFRYELQSDGYTLNIIPEEMLSQKSEYEIKIELQYCTWDDKQDSIKSNLVFVTSQVSKAEKLMITNGSRYDIVHMAVPQPTIVPSLDQIGLASLTIPYAIIKADDKTGRFIAWGVQKFGEEGVPQKRISYYAFNGKNHDNFFIMESKNCLFEITAMNIPLDNFRVSGFITQEGNALTGSNLTIEKYWGKSILKLLREMGGSSPINAKIIWQHLKNAGIRHFIKGASKFVPALYRQFKRNSYKTWGLLNHRDSLNGIGTFKLISKKNQYAEDKILDGLEVIEFSSNLTKRRIIAEVHLPHKEDKWDTSICILLINSEELSVYPINYNNAMEIKHLEDSSRAVLTIPKKLNIIPGKNKALLMIDLNLYKELDL